MRQQRRQLSAAQQERAAHQLDQQLHQAGILSDHQHIAFYLASDGEIDPQYFLSRALAGGTCCYLPVVCDNQQLGFVRYSGGDELVPNRFGIPEPVDASQPTPAWELEAVLLPLVGFDRDGGRLGMGGGFYDRSLSGSGQAPEARRPRLIGLAHSCQEVNRLEMESWDIPLDEIVTEREVIKARSK